jgi:hypothetical protein
MKFTDWHTRHYSLVSALVGGLAILAAPAFHDEMVSTMKRAAKNSGVDAAPRSRAPVGGACGASAAGEQQFHESRIRKLPRMENRPIKTNLTS